MINMKDLIKKQTDMIRKESGMNTLSEKLTEVTGKPEIGDYLKDGNMLFGKIVDIRHERGKHLAFAKQIKGKFGRGVQHVGYYYSWLKDSGKQKGGKTIWEV